MKIGRLSKIYSDSEQFGGVIINSGGSGKINNASESNSDSLEKAIKATQESALMRTKTLNQMTENTARLKSAQMRKDAAEQRIAQYNRRLEVRKDEANARVMIQNKKAEISEKNKASENLRSFKLPTRINTPISRNNQTRINK